MCRLFGLTAGANRVKATFWLLEAPDNLDAQSRKNADGTGLGTFSTSGQPVIEKQPLAAYEDASFVSEAKERESTTFVAHVRHATGTPKTVWNTHPFEMDGRIFAHNGAIGELGTLERELGDAMNLVKGDTDSERIAALITRNVRNGQDVGAAMTDAVKWLADNVPVTAVNLLVSTPTDLWTLRYPETNELYLLDRPGGSAVDHRSDEGTHVASDELAQKPCVVVASERLDDDPGWTLIPSGTLVHIDENLRIRQEQVMASQPKRTQKL